MKKISIFLFSFIVFNHSILLAYSSDPSEFVNELVTEAISKLSDKNLSKEDWDTYWGWNSQRQRNIKSGEKGVRLEVKAPMRRFYRDAPLFKTHPKTGKHLLDKNGNKIPLITVDVFKKSFFHISQTELKRTGSDCK